MVKAVEEIRATNPMAGSITNTVTIDFVANAQLAVGGSAAMVYLPDEGEALVAGGGAIYLNMGTLFPIYEQTIPRAAKAAHDAGKPWVLDPVGLGIGSLRTKLVSVLKQYKPTIVRGNASEIIALAGLWGLEGEAADLSRVRGVDTTDTVDAARDAAVALARYTGGAVVVSGEVDLITDGTTVAKSHGGSPLMSKITGCGCSQGGVLAVYACATDPFTAAVCGTAVYNVAGTRAAAVADAPASFKVAFIDELYRATAQDIADNRLELEEA
ncbi:hydroxyethylthiazole kinase [Collinsella sp. AM36-4AA]|nr:hydroxyethylthiazole kinase [Collinsella sp. AM36-4AA]RHI28192.1 hydroxyethylthiazole kinase [Collinsella sp. AM15-2]